MCGILGLCSSEIASFEKFKGSLDKIAHRGADGHGIWCNENKNVMLGHRRLSIIDLSDNAHQPMVLGNRYVLTFNGEIYNYLELKKELEKNDIQCVSETDTEVIVNTIELNYLIEKDVEKAIEKLVFFRAYLIIFYQIRRVKSFQLYLI
mgnify:CR=1 FL=1